MPGLGGRRPTGNHLRCDRESNQIETFSFDGQAETSTANEGWPGPGSQGYSIPYYKPTQIRTKQVDSLSPIGRPALSNLRISC